MKSSPNFNERYFKKVSGRIIILLLLFIGALGLFTIISHEVLWDKEEELDHNVFEFLAEHVVSPSLTPFMETVTYFASSSFLQIAYGLVILLYLIRKNWKRALEIGVIGIGGFLVNYIMKLSFQRVRPSGPLIDPLHNFSFPSGHATSGFIFYGLLVYLIWKAEIPRIYKYLIGFLLILFALLIGFSRVYLRVHYPTDVIAGFCIGLAWLMLCIWLLEKLKKKSNMELEASRHHKAI
ncbi:MAG TPA: phosphatase PAP2 family protein [Chitinophagaceae bacterium]|nr:phosphatase PAP2 family protein [Chitinophagaceae bacterium]